MYKDTVKNVKFQIYTRIFGKNYFSNGIGSEREKNTALRGRKEVISMELSSSQRKTIRHQFDSYCKKVLRGEYHDCLREIRRVLQHEVSFSRLSRQELAQLFVVDEYSTNETYFDVLGYDIAVKSDLVSEALAILPTQKREIILMSYFLNMTDQEIGEKLNLMRSTVQYQRTSSLKQLKKLLEGKDDEET